MEHLFNTDQEGYNKFLKNKPLFKTIKGEPQATDKYTTTELKSMGLFGIYAVEEECNGNQ